MGRSVPYQETPDMVGHIYALRDATLKSHTVLVLRVDRAGSGFSVTFRVNLPRTSTQRMALGDFRKKFPQLISR